MKKPNHDRIYLLPEDGIWCWADRPAPGIGQSNDDAVEYVRADLHEQVATQRDSAMSQLETARTAINNNFNQLREHADKMQAERDELAAMLVALRGGYKVLCDIGLRDVLDAGFNNDAPEPRLRELQAQAVEEAAHHFVENGGACVTELQEYAESIRKGDAA